ncbi:hypothetical protein ACVNNN_13545 [Lysinibacillus fusiformis]|uniref:hypothetical protein n=1 Tax=Lysinibacillus sp. PWR01 TaxID=3342384 RepID=UPI00372D0BE5
MGEEWYSNKELFEQINALRGEIQETRNLIKQYNGLREEYSGLKLEVDHVKELLVQIEAVSIGNNKVLEAIRNWGGWAVAIIALVLNFMKL